MWLEVIEFGLKEVKELFLTRKEEKAKSYEAIEAVYEAANKTTAFLKEYASQARKSNMDLSTIWKDAATKVRALDENLYFRLLGKAEYWSNPEIWTDEKIAKANITLEAIKKDSRLIIAGRKK